MFNQNRRPLFRNGQAFNFGPPPPVPIFDAATSSYVLRLEIAPITMFEAAEKYIGEQAEWHSKKTENFARDLYNRFRRFHGDDDEKGIHIVMVHELTLDHFLRFLGTLMIKKISRRAYTLRFVTFLNWAVEKRHIPFEVAEPIIKTIFISCKDVKSLATFVPLTRDQIRRCFEFLGLQLRKGRIKAYRNFVLFRLFYDMNIRDEEARTLRIGDIDFERSVMCVNMGKGQKTRYLQIPEDVLATLQGWISIRKKMSDAVFELDQPLLVWQGRPLTHDITYRFVRDLFRYCKIDRSAKLGPHILRHTGLTHKAEEGWPIEVLRDWAGHDNVATTNGYLHASGSVQRECVEKKAPFRVLGRLDGHYV